MLLASLEEIAVANIRQDNAYALFYTIILYVICFLALEKVQSRTIMMQYLRQYLRPSLKSEVK
jgi:hypothetical protein